MWLMNALLNHYRIKTYSSTKKKRSHDKSKDYNLYESECKKATIQGLPHFDWLMY